MRPLSLLATAALSTATSSSLGGSFFEGVAYTATTAPRKLLVGSPSTIALFSYTAGTLSLLANETLAGSAPSWMLLKPPTTLYAVNENSNTVRRLHLDTVADTIAAVDTVEADAGAVHLALAPGGRQLISSVYGSGVVDVFAVADDNSLALNTTWSMGAKGTSHPHQTVVHPAGSFAVTNDLGLDQLIITPLGASSTATSVRINTPSGCGPRHGAFLSSTYYAVVCEEANLVILYKADLSASAPTMAEMQVISTFPNNASNADARAGELVASASGEHVYVSNRLTGATTDSLTHLTFDADTGTLAHVQTVSSGGLLPRMMSLAPACKGGDLLFVGNQKGSKGLVVFAVGEDGTIGEEMAAVEMGFWGAEDEGLGPQFVQEVPLCSV